MKFNIHPSCSCRQCRRGKHTKYGQFTRNHAERTARAEWKSAERSIIGGSIDPDEYTIPLAFTPFTD